VPQFDTAKLDIMSAAENISDIPLAHAGVDETNRYMFCKEFQEVLILSHFTLGLGYGKMLW
jgi:uncharacterized radical SAM superfamily protein